MDDSTHHTESYKYIQILEHIFVCDGNIHYTASQVFFCLIIFIISCFYQLIHFLSNCRNLADHLRSSWTYMSLLSCVVVLGHFWQVMIPSTSDVSSVYGMSQIEIICQCGVTVQVHVLKRYTKNRPRIARTISSVEEIREECLINVRAYW